MPALSSFTGTGCDRNYKYFCLEVHGHGCKGLHFKMEGVLRSSVENDARFDDNQ